MQKLKQKKTWFTLGIIISIVLFANQIIKSLERLDVITLEARGLKYFWAAFLILVLVRGAQMVAWRYLMLGYGVQIGFGALFKNYTLSLLPRYLPGNVFGYLTRAEWLASSYSVGYGLTNWGSLIEACLVVSSYFEMILIYGCLQVQGWERFLLLFAVVGLPYISWCGYKILMHNKLAIKMLNRVFNLSPEQTIIEWKIWLLVFGIYWLAWLGFGGAMRSLLLAFAAWANVGWIEHAFLFGAAWLIGFLIVFVPSGLGVREQVYSMLLMESVGVQSGLASVMAIVSRGLILMSELAWLLIGILIRFVPLRRN